MTGPLFVPPTDALFCEECNEETIFPTNPCFYAGHLWDIQSYLHCAPCEVLQMKVWCGVCNRPEYAERIPSQREFEHAFILRKSETLMAGSPRAQYGDREPLHMLELPHLLFLAQGLGERAGPGKCLGCGGRSYFPIRMSEGRVEHLRHERCGGAFLLHARYPIDGEGRRDNPPRWYDFTGRLLGSVEEREFWKLKDEPGRVFNFPRKS